MWNQAASAELRCSDQQSVSQPILVPMLLLPSYHIIVTSQSHESQLTELLSQLLDKGPLFSSQISLTNNKHQRLLIWRQMLETRWQGETDGLYWTLMQGRQDHLWEGPLSVVSVPPQWTMMLRVSQWQILPEAGGAGDVTYCYLPWPVPCLHAGLNDHSLCHPRH